GLREGEEGLFGSTEWYRNYLAVTGACMMVPRAVYDDVGGYNEAYQLAFGDVDLCLRIVQYSYRVMYTPFARLIHHESVSRGRYIPTNDLIEGYADFKAQITAGDPYFNPNLSYRHPTPEFRKKTEGRIELLRRIIARRLAVE
ncbi:MAG: O-antigen biosynthesis protein, partial [Anaerolineales bacterium]